jgi:hypothetical protein
MLSAWNFVGSRRFRHEEFEVYVKALPCSKHEVSATRKSAGVSRLFFSACETKA